MVMKDACVFYKLQKEEGDNFFFLYKDKLIHDIWVALHCGVY